MFKHGDSIQCWEDESSVKQSFYNTYCNLMGTYSLPENIPSHVWWSHYRELYVRRQTTSTVPEEGLAEHHEYYHWVPLALVFQAMSFYGPYGLWKLLEQQILHK